MIKVYLSINNNQEVILLPVSPTEYDVGRSRDNQTMEGLKGSLIIAGLPNLKTIRIDSFFPYRDYPFLLSRSMFGQDYVNKIESWRNLRIPIRLVITERTGKKVVNIPVLIDRFDTTTQPNLDISYTLEMTEFTFVKV